MTEKGERHGWILGRRLLNQLHKVNKLNTEKGKEKERNIKNSLA